MNPNRRSDSRATWRRSAIAVGAIGAALFITGPARAAESPSGVGASATSSHHLRLDMPNDTPDAGFAAGPYGSLISAPDLVPGAGGSVVVGLRNEGPGAGIATLQVTDLLNLEVGCSTSEAAVDITCGSPNPGELADTVRLTVSAREQRAGTFRGLFSGTAGDLADDTLPHLLGIIDEDAEWDVRVDYRFLDKAGNETMTDSLAWNFAFGLHGTEGLDLTSDIGLVARTDPPAVGVVGEVNVVLPNLGGPEVLGLDVKPDGSLPTTGAQVGRVVAGAALAILAGLFVFGLRRLLISSSSRSVGIAGRKDPPPPRTARPA